MDKKRTSKHKKLYAGLGILIALVMALALSACGMFRIGTPDDNFPYDSAVQDGYTGSEGQWLDEQQQSSTVYRRMWQEAVADGSFTGTYYEFLKSLNLSDDATYLQRSLLSVVSIVSRTALSSGGTAGSGVIISLDKNSGDGYVLTNYHVVYNTETGKIYDTFELNLYGGEVSGRTLSATFVGGSIDHDIAILRLQGSDTAGSGTSLHTNASVISDSAALAAEIGDSDSLMVGEKVYAIGNPEAWGVAVVGGVVSVDAEYVEMTAIDGSGSVSMLEIRTDAAVNHGNSGGGLFNAAGQLIGIVNARSEKSGVEGVGYSIPIDLAIGIAENVLENGAFKSAKLGVSVKVSDSRSVYDQQSGRTFISEKVTLQEVTSGGAALAAGLDVGDTLVSVTLNGKTTMITRMYKLSNALLRVRQGDTLTVEISRGGVNRTISVLFDKASYFVTK